MKVLYGINGNTIDVTSICYSTLLHNDIITIPSNDFTRANYFTDPLLGIQKKVYIMVNNNVLEYDYQHTITINIVTNNIQAVCDNDIDNKLLQIHSKLRMNYGNIVHELPEQKMAVRYLTGKEKVLEIGGNIGRNSLVIASILHDQKNQVTLESDANIAIQLTENRDNNQYTFHIENAALSKRKLIQKGWDTVPSDTLLDGYNWVKTITLEELRAKYPIAFDTLVLDCEGAFYYILMDMPDILSGITLIIMENDYGNITHKQYIDNVMQENGFKRNYVEGGGWGCCANNFYEAWVR